MPSPLCELSIDLDAIVDNWRSLRALTVSAECAAVVKADAYGLGVKPVAQALASAGCKVFFVASLTEGRALRAYIPTKCDIYLLSGVYPGEEAECLSLGLLPVLVSWSMLRRWIELSSSKPKRAALKLDTGMSRLGLSSGEFERLLAEPESLQRAGVELVMSHLACADEPEHPQNKIQLEQFLKYRGQLLSINAQLTFSLANSAGVGLGEAYFFDLVRPGIALYGSTPASCHGFYSESVVDLRLPIIQARRVPAGTSAGYGATWVSEQETVLVTVAGGYADGLLRAMGNQVIAYLGDKVVRQVGRVSMDSIIFDVGVGAVPDEESEFPKLELLGAHQSVDALAVCADTIAYEILTSLGERFPRHYKGGRV